MMRPLNIRANKAIQEGLFYSAVDLCSVNPRSLS